ncbi:MAG TPA: YecH family metal-binding protein [Polyangiaceae bacterium]|nr:YecH family metal-binding protein [Polyangiaceae bacterium]
MTQEVHGHEVLERIINAGGVMPLSQLRSSAATAFGTDAQYYTCSARGMSFDDLLGFLVQRQKISVVGENVTVHAESMCQHSGSHSH